jgi:hypothetical protein
MNEAVTSALTYQLREANVVEGSYALGKACLTGRDTYANPKRNVYWRGTAL